MHSIENTILLDDASPLRNVNGGTWQVPLTNPLEVYIYGCGKGISIVSAAMDKAEIAIELLKTSYEQTPKTDRFTADEFIEYAIESYLVRSHAIYDRALIFVNKLFDLGIADESISHNLLVTNEHVKNSGLADLLKQVRKKCSEYRLDRNKIIHHGRFSEDKFNLLAAMHKVNKIRNHSGEPPIYEEELLERLTHEQIVIKVDEFQKHYDLIREEIEKMYTLSERIYLQRREMYVT